GITLEYYYCDAADIDGMLDVLDFLKSRAVDLYIIRGVKSNLLKDRLNELTAPVIFIDSTVPGAKNLCFIGEDCYQSGRIAASLLAKTIPAGSDVAVISGSQKVSGHKLRLQGFLDAIHAHGPDIRVVEQLYSQDQSVIAYETACRVLDQHPELRGICNLAGHSGEVGQAILDMHRQEMVKMVCYNHTEDITALIQKKVVEFSIDLFPARQGQILLETAYRFLMNQRVPPETIYTPITIVMDENVSMMAEALSRPQKGP
ncbi:MAG: substrate-binding domain-containing protein, partial [Butyricicoccus sp.]